MPIPERSFTMDSLLNAADSALRTLFAHPRAAMACPTVAEQATQLDAAQTRAAASLMRVNHVGEICAQALYTAQALSTSNPPCVPTSRAHASKKLTIWHGPHNA
jgi:demethoxyubiquinone hydroxylase (CLK1/Coq7/Cat5 family)